MRERFGVRLAGVPSHPVTTRARENELGLSGERGRAGLSAGEVVPREPFCDVASSLLGCKRTCVDIRSRWTTLVLGPGDIPSAAIPEGAIDPADLPRLAPLLAIRMTDLLLVLEPLKAGGRFLVVIGAHAAGGVEARLSCSAKISRACTASSLPRFATTS